MSNRHAATATRDRSQSLAPRPCRRRSASCAMSGGYGGSPSPGCLANTAAESVPAVGTLPKRRMSRRSHGADMSHSDLLLSGTTSWVVTAKSVRG